MTTRRSLLWTFVLACAFSLLAGDALAARKVRADGFWRFEIGIGIPLQFQIPGAGEGTMANDTIWLGFPNPDPPISGDLSLTGKSPAAFTIPTGFVAGSYTALLNLMGTMNIQITTMFSISRPASMAGTGVFGAGGGPGSFTFCPGTPPGLPGAACPAPPAAPQGTGTRNGRIVYTGGGGFGGTARALLAGTGALSLPRMGFGFGSTIFQAQHDLLGGSATFVVGSQGAVSFAVPMGMPVVTQPKTAPTTLGTISAMAVGPLVTSMNALTSCPATPMGGAYPNIPLTGSLACVTGTGPPLGGTGASRTQTGFGFTTGTVLHQITSEPANPGLYTISGTDTRTARGIGNISMVAGALNTSTRPGEIVISRSPARITITFSEKVPSLTPGALAAAAALMLLTAGYGLRRRF